MGYLSKRWVAILAGNLLFAGANGVWAQTPTATEPKLTDAEIAQPKVTEPRLESEVAASNDVEAPAQANVEHDPEPNEPTRSSLSHDAPLSPEPVHHAPGAGEAKPGATTSQQGASTAEVDESNNPLALLMSANIHAYVTPTLKGLPDSSATNSFLRLSIPFWRILPRVSLPLSNLSTPTSNGTGIGDLQAFATVILTNPKSPLELGVGPLYVAPTASAPALGTGKHQAGAAAITVYKNPGLLVGTLVQYQLSFAGEARPDTEILTAQLFVIAQIGGGFYLRSTPMATFDVQNGVYNLPVGIGGGKVLKAGRMMLNFFLEPQYVLLADGVGQPMFQVFSGINIQTPL